MDAWNQKARNIIKAELARRGITYDTLRQKLADIGIQETPNNLSVKINRGTFSFTFFLQCMKALEIQKIYLED